ncbi:hypothetical protein D3C81_827160 [compost metagenome]
MGGINPGGTQSSTPSSLPTGTPQQFGMPDHSFTLQAIMELQKSCGALTAKLDSLSGQIDRMEQTIKSDANRFDDKLDDVDQSVRDVETRIKIGTKVAYILFAMLVAVVGVGWTLTQDAFKDVTKTAINSALLSKTVNATPQPEASTAPSSALKPQGAIGQ